MLSFKAYNFFSFISSVAWSPGFLHCASIGFENCGLTKATTKATTTPTTTPSTTASTAFQAVWNIGGIFGPNHVYVDHLAEKPSTAPPTTAVPGKSFVIGATHNFDENLRLTELKNVKLDGQSTSMVEKITALQSLVRTIQLDKAKLSVSDSAQKFLCRQEWVKYNTNFMKTLLTIYLTLAIKCGIFGTFL